MNALGISTDVHRYTVVIFNILLSHKRDQYFAVSQNIYECHFGIWQHMVFKGHAFLWT